MTMVQAAHNGFGQSKDDTGYSPFEASSAIPSPDLTPHKVISSKHFTKGQPCRFMAGLLNPSIWFDHSSTNSRVV
jgi:hypothetical protein